MPPTSDLGRSAPAQSATDTALKWHARAAETSPVPVAILQGKAHVIRYVNPAFCRLTLRAASELEGQRYTTLSREPERVEALLERATQSRSTELSPDIAYVSADQEPLFGTTMALPVQGESNLGLVVHVLETTKLSGGRSQPAQSAQELREANERLLLASLREQELTERANQATHALEQVLQRKSMLAEANALLSASLDLGETLKKVAGLAVPELADGGIVELTLEGGSTRHEVAHVDPATEQLLRELDGRLSADFDLQTLRSRVLETGKPYVLPDLASADAELTGIDEGKHGFLRELGARSYLAVPLEARGQALGMLTLVACNPGARFRQIDVEFALELGRRASVALDNARLYQDAQDALSLREDVIAIISHDLRNPLSAITMSTQRMLARPEVSDAGGIRKGLELVQRSAKHMRRMIEELLEVASVQTNQLRLELTEVKLGELLDDAMEMLDPVAQKKGVQLERQVADLALTAHCDRERAIRVLTNLVGNAIKFTPAQGTVRVTVHTLEDELRVQVQDTGPGIPSADQAKLFERYWKGMRTGRSGMGLGLYIARGIVEAHGGRIWVDSVVGVGSTFTFTLPLSLR
jgi:signal transduction histidine kinase